LYESKNNSNLLLQESNLAYSTTIIKVDTDAKEGKMNYGMKVAIKYNEKHTNRVKEEILNNVTEIHYNFPSVISGRIAFESDIHNTGCLRAIDEIEEFETIPQMEKAKEF
jgi:hypothetical protein